MRRAGAVVFAGLLAIAAVVLLVPAARRDAWRPGDAIPTASASASQGPYRPKPIPRIDVHTHVDPEVAHVAERILRSYGVVRALNLSGGWPGEGGLEETLAGARGFFLVSSNIDFRGIGEKGWADREVRRLDQGKKLGVRGVKIGKALGLAVRFPDGRRVPVDDPALDPVFEAAGRLGLPVSIHTGDPKAFFDPLAPQNERWDELEAHPSWSFADRDRYPSWEALIDEFERRLSRSPGTTFVGVHFGNAPEEPARVARMLAAHPNLWIDTAARIPEIGRRPAETRKTILEHAGRVVFGTDLQVGDGFLVLGAGPPTGHTQEDVDRFFLSSWRFFETRDRQFPHPTPIQGRWRIDGLGLPDEVLHAVYHANAERLFGFDPAVPGR